MNKNLKKKIISSSIGLIISLLLFFSSGVKLPILDSTADKYFNEAIAKAGIAYATCRVVNASISVVKESNVQMEPAGVGVSLALGQALDPIDDMTERLSNVLVTSITALGVQKLAYEMSVSLAFPILAIFTMILSILVWFNYKWVESVKSNALRALLIILIARFCLPISSLANEFLHENFFEAKIAESNNKLSQVTTELDKLKDFTLPETSGFLGTISNSASFLKQKTIELRDAISATVSNMGNIIENLLKLTFLYVSLFLIQVIILPILVFWLLVKLINSLFDKKVQTILTPHTKAIPE